jgi:YHS domain-containing protein
MNKATPSPSASPNQAEVEHVGAHTACSSSNHATSVAGTGRRSLKDPVCGMTVTAQSQYVLQHEGQSFYFCGASCKAKFAANPAEYAAIENFRNVNTLIVDKTGTLTEGKPRFDRSAALSGYTEDEMLRLAASLDQGRASIGRRHRESGTRAGSPVGKSRWL